MASGKAERSLGGGAEIRLATWAASGLAVLLIPHAWAAAVTHWPPGLISIHVGMVVFAGLAALMLACTRQLAQYGEDRVQAAYDAGRVESLAAELEEFERRLNGK